MDYSQRAVEQVEGSSSFTAGPCPAHEGSCRTDRAAKVKKAIGTAGRFVVQLTFLAGVCYLGGAIASVLPIGIPGNIVSMVLLLVLLVTGMLESTKIDLASNFLLKFMPLFFIPAGVSIMGCFPIIAGNLPQFALVCIITTVLVFAVTSATVTAAMKVQARWARRGCGVDAEAGAAEGRAASTEKGA